MIELSRQQRWQLKKMAAGYCRQCGCRRLTAGSKNYCSPCLVKHCKRNRVGYKPWRKGDPGRPPLDKG